MPSAVLENNPWIISEEISIVAEGVTNLILEYGLLPPPRSTTCKTGSGIA